MSYGSRRSSFEPITLTPRLSLSALAYVSLLQQVLRQEIRQHVLYMLSYRISDWMNGVLCLSRVDPVEEFSLLRLRVEPSTVDLCAFSRPP